MNINGRKIGSQQAPYIIAEMSNNHLNDLDRAYRLLDIAKAAGVDAVKIQTYTADSLTIDCDKSDFVISDPLWQGKSYYDLYQEITMPVAWNKKLFDRAFKLGITLFSSPFDAASVDLLEDLNCPAYKIASFEAKDHAFIQKVASTAKPIIMSTGISSLMDVQESIVVAQDAGCQDIAILHCVSSYPSDVGNMNIDALSEFSALGVEIGLSDHSLDNLAAILSVAYGASIIEKHFTERRVDGGPDAAFSLEPRELKNLKEQTELAWKAKGSADVLNSQRLGAHHARSLYFVSDVKKGELLTPENVRSIRPGFGLEPKLLNQVLGKNALENIARGTPVSWELIV